MNDVFALLEDSALYPEVMENPKEFKEENHVIQIRILRKVSPAGAGTAGCGRYGEKTWGRVLGQGDTRSGPDTHARGLGADSGRDHEEQAADQKGRNNLLDSSDLHSHMSISLSKSTIWDL